MSVLMIVSDMEVSDEINACSVEIEVDVDGVKEPGPYKLKTKPTTTQREIGAIAERLLVSVCHSWPVVRAFTFTKLAYFRCQTLLRRFSETRAGKLPQRVISENSGSWLFFCMVTKLVWQRLTFVNTSPAVFVAKRMELGAVVGGS